MTMRDKKRINRILDKIKKIWDVYPEQRFFQLLFNYTSLGTRTEPLGTIQDPFYYDDDRIEQELDNVIDWLKEQRLLR